MSWVSAVIVIQAMRFLQMLEGIDVFRLQIGINNLIIFDILFNLINISIFCPPGYFNKINNLINLFKCPMDILLLLTKFKKAMTWISAVKAIHTMRFLQSVDGLIRIRLWYINIFYNYKYIFIYIFFLFWRYIF